MKKGTLIRRICVIAGAAMLVGALVALIGWQWNVYDSQKQAGRLVETLYALMPETRDAIVEERRDNTMSMLSIDGRDFVGIIEMPQYGLKLPVSGEWGHISRYPCHLSGSIYDGSLQIGATTQEGQYNFYREISLDDTVVFTDVEGNRYTFRVSAMRYEKHIDQASLQRENADLTLFVKNVYAFAYLVIFCENEGI